MYLRAMKSRRITLYAMYALPALGLLGLLYTGFAPLRLQTPFTQLLPKLLFILYMLINYKGVYSWLNPGVKMHRAAKEEQVLNSINVKSSWRFVARALRLVMCVFFAVWAASWAIVSKHPDYGWIGVLLVFSIMLGIGFVHYVNNPPQRILVTEKGLYSYVWSYRFFAWEQMKHITEKPEWMAFGRKGKADYDINYEELDGSPNELVQAIKPVASSHNITYIDNSQEYNPAV